jgi:hypothetical protein
MTEFELHDGDVPEPEVAEPQTPDGSVWAQLQAEHAEISRSRDPLYLDVPGYSGLVIRYHFVELSETERTTRELAKVKAVTQQTLLSSIDTLILACDEILVAAPDGQKPVGASGQSLYPLPVKPLGDPGEPPVRFDHRLSEGLEWPANMKARQIVHKLFGGKKGEYRIIGQAQEVSAWIAGERQEIAEEFLGG